MGGVGRGVFFGTAKGNKERKMGALRLSLKEGSEHLEEGGQHLRSLRKRRNSIRGGGETPAKQEEKVTARSRSKEEKES